MAKKCKKCKVPLEGFLYRMIAARLFGVRPSTRDPELRKVFIRTFGCQMNVRDSEVVCGLLEKEGYKFTDEPAKADIVLFNTCSVRQHAEDKVWSEVGRLKTRKPVIGIIGCMAQQHKENIFQRAAGVDFVAGPQDLHKIPEIIKKFAGRPAQAGSPCLFETKIWETDSASRPEEIYHTGFYADKKHAYVVISEGCSNFCSYCVVPFVRGQIRHRNYKDILQEIEWAVAKGITKITLLGQNVNAFKSIVHSPKSIVDFIELLKIVNDVKDIKEFSFITSHPKDTSLELFKAMAGLDKLKKYLHLPVQSGCDRILKLMNRGYTGKSYLELANQYRRVVKGGALTTDIIVGFPGETDEDFKETYNLARDIEFNAAYIFKYSPRPNTEAQKLVDDVPKEEKERRHRLILDLQRRISTKKKC